MNEDGEGEGEMGVMSTDIERRAQREDQRDDCHSARQQDNAAPAQEKDDETDSHEKGNPQVHGGRVEQVVRAQRRNRQSIEIAGQRESQQVAVQFSEISRWIGYPVDVLWSEESEEDRIDQESPSDHCRRDAVRLQVMGVDGEMSSVGKEVEGRRADSHQHHAGEDLGENEELRNTHQTQECSRTYRVPSLTHQDFVEQQEEQWRKGHKGQEQVSTLRQHVGGEAVQQAADEGRRPP